MRPGYIQAKRAQGEGRHGASACHRIAQERPRGTFHRTLSNRTGAATAARLPLLLACSAARAMELSSVLSSCTMCSRPAFRCCSACSCSAAAGDRQVATTRVLGRSTSCRTNSRPRPRLLPCTSATRVPEPASPPPAAAGLLPAAAATAREREWAADHRGAALIAPQQRIVAARCMAGAQDQQGSGRRRASSAAARNAHSGACNGFAAMLACLQEAICSFS